MTQIFEATTRYRYRRGVRRGFSSSREGEMVNKKAPRAKWCEGLFLLLAAYIEDEVVVVVVVVDMAASDMAASEAGAMASTAGEVTSVEVSVVVVVSAGFEQAATESEAAATAAIAMNLNVLRMIVIPSHQDVKDYGEGGIWKRCGCGADSIKIS